MKYVVLDFETTGSQPGDEIIQVGLVTIQDDEIVETYASLIKPTIPVPAFITALTGIDDTMLQDAPAVEEVLPEVVKRLEGSVLVAHNAGFDVAFLQRTLDYCGYSPYSGPVLDTMDFLRIAFPSLPSLQLGSVCQSLNIEHDRPHQADSDALATALIWQACVKRLGALPLLTLQRIVYLLSRETSDTAAFFGELLLRKENENPPDDGEQRYYRQFALNVDDWGDEQPLREEEDVKERVGLPFDSFYEQFKINLRAKFAGYESREAQEQMIHEVALSLAEDRHLLIEAGTGTGKSLGYLLPALYYGINEGQKVVISTHTINLQEQLRQRDVPLLGELFPVPFRASVLKGRSHYLCLRKFEHKIENEDFEYVQGDRQIAAQMLVWLGETKHGDDEELYLAGRGSEFWQTVSSDAESCLNRACPWFKKCFYHRAKHEANIADVVITNHSLLFTDIKADHRLLPGYKHLVVDEAHHFEEVASKHLGIELHYHAFAHALQALYRDARSGQLPALRARFGQASGELAEQGAAWASLIDQQLEPLIAVKEMWDELIFLLYELVSSSQQDAEGGGQYVLRIKDEQLPRRWTELCDMEDNIHVKLGGVLRKLEKALAEWKDVQDEYDVQSLVTDVGGTLKELGRHRDALRFFMKRTDPSYVYWLEASAQFKAKSLLINCAPTDVSPMLRQYFFNEKKSIIMTSATLSVDRKFDYTRELLGLSDENDETKLKAVILPSPFQYRKQALVVIPRDFPGIKGQSGDAYFVSCLIQSLKDVAIETKGRMLVLFTSYRMLKTVHPELRELLQPHGIEVLGQGIDSGNRSKLTKLFQESAASVLLGTSSFWEGVDIPGDALSVLAIVRLPFQPPNHPVAEAKSELIKKENKNPFMKLSVPQAVIRFKQGFGRLVRTARDKGIVIVYDTRVIDTQYGKHFLYSLPGPKIEHMRTNQLVPRISEWMNEAAKEEPC